jgi:hypothetical protein
LVYHEKLKAGIVSAQCSPDEMFAALAVEIVEKEETKIENFILNLSNISKTSKFSTPFTRVMPLGADCSSFSGM